jgi:UDP-GlcNAc:undecaprenyl-phosphate GlcNAc-1-phosphate transferase
VAGGIVLIASLLGAMGLLFVLPTSAQEELHERQAETVSFLGSASVICLVGVIDDSWNLRGWIKLLGQLLAIGVVLSSGLLISNVRFLSYNLELGPLGAPFTVVLLLGAINSLNLIDGMDGLLSTVGFIITLAIGGMALWTGHAVHACIAFALAAALLAFLCYNLPPASIFLGDSGSMLIGLTIGVLAIRSSIKTPATLALGLPLAILAVPFLDTCMAISRRKLTGRSIYCSDRAHLHHCLQRRGYSNYCVLLLVAMGVTATASAALIGLIFSNDLLPMATTLSLGAVLILSGWFGRAECVLLKQRLASLLSSMSGVSPTSSQEIEARLQGCLNWEDLWSPLKSCAVELDLDRLCLDVNAPALHEGYFAQWRRGGAPRDEETKWAAEIPLASRTPAIGLIKIAGRGCSTSALQALSRVSAIAEQFWEQQQVPIKALLPSTSSSLPSMNGTRYVRALSECLAREHVAGTNRNDHSAGSHQPQHRPALNGRSQGC